MGDPDGPVLQLRELLALLSRHGVEFLMFGGQAATVYGAERLSHDLDLCIRWSPENLDRMGRVLPEIEAGLRVEGSPGAVQVPHRDGRFMEVWRSRPGGPSLATWT